MIFKRGHTPDKYENEKQNIKKLTKMFVKDEYLFKPELIYKKHEYWKEKYFYEVQIQKISFDLKEFIPK
jgi:hypothetical protein